MNSPSYPTSNSLLAPQTGGGADGSMASSASTAAAENVRPLHAPSPATLGKPRFRKMRLIAPNLVTASSVLFGLASILASTEGRYVDACWLIGYAVLADRLDGFLARLLKGTSELGVQMDSLADFLNFGVAPAILFFTLLQNKMSDFQGGNGRLVLLGTCAFWVLCAMFRLARFNVGQEVGPTIVEEDASKKFYFGMPSTLVGGLLIMWLLAFLKYADPADPMAPAQAFGGFKLFGDITTPRGIWKWFPLAMVIGAVLMTANMPIPKLGHMTSKLFAAFVLTNVGLGYVFGIMRIFPDFMIWGPSMWFVLFLVTAFTSKAARRAKPPPLFPQQ